MEPKVQKKVEVEHVKPKLVGANGAGIYRPPTKPMREIEVPKPKVQKKVEVEHVKPKLVGANGAGIYRPPTKTIEIIPANAEEAKKEVEPVEPKKVGGPSTVYRPPAKKEITL